VTGIDRLAQLYPWSVDPDEELRRAVVYLGWDVSATRLVRASYGCGIVGIGLTVGSAVLAPSGVRTLATLVSATLALLAVGTLTALPRLLATAKRTRALGDAPGLVGRAVLSMRLFPSPERAASFAARSTETALSENLEQFVRRSRATNEDALRNFGSTWQTWFPALERSLAMVASAGTLSDDDRQDALDRALSVVLDGTRKQLRDFAEQIRGPVTALYAFGILLPTALVALLPAGAAAGIGVTLPAIVLVYDIALPAVLIGASAWLLAHRPAAFPPPSIRRSHPDVPDRIQTAAVAGCLAAVTGWFVAGLVCPPWARPIAALGLGVGTGLQVQFRPYLAVQKRVRAIEDGLTDALTLVGRRVSNGRSVESAVANAASALAEPTGTVFEQAAATQRQLQTDIERAFHNGSGNLSAVPSARVRESVAFLGVAAAYGQPAGTAILALADHIDELQQVEDEASHALAAVCGALRSTGALFGPMVAGATVALADGVAGAGTEPLPGDATALPWLGLAVGWYVLVLAVVLPTLATGLVRGLDRALVGVRVGQALLSGTVVYLTAYLLVGGIA
jgi:Flp pilus assembly protein TadB